MIVILTLIIKFRWSDFFMARPIANTPPLEGEDAIEVLKKMLEPPTENDKEFAREIRNQRIVLF